MLDQTSNATNVSALDKENYARAYLVLYRVSIMQFFFLVIENATLAVITIFFSFIWSKWTKFRRLLVDNKRSKISDKIRNTIYIYILDMFKKFQVIDNIFIIN